MINRQGLTRLIFAGLAFLMLPGFGAEKSGTNSPAAAKAPNPPPSSPESAKIKEAVRDMQDHEMDAALTALNGAIRINPQNQVPYFLRASISASRSLWSEAEKDLLVAESITPDDIDIEMFLGDVFLMEKSYDNARKRFASLTRDTNRGDLATYKVYVCDALDGQTETATKELAALDHTPSKPSCYYAHATRSLLDNKVDEGRRWLDSASVLYGPAVTSPYDQCLRAMGILPAPKAKP